MPFERERGRKKLVNLIEEKKLVRKKFEEELRIHLRCHFVSADPSGLLRYIEGYPVFKKDGDKEAAVSALEDISML